MEYGEVAGGGEAAAKEKTVAGRFWRGPAVSLRLRHTQGDNA